MSSSASPNAANPVLPNVIWGDGGTASVAAAKRLCAACTGTARPALAPVLVLSPVLLTIALTLLVLLPTPLAPTWKLQGEGGKRGDDREDEDAVDIKAAPTTKGRA